MGSYYDCHGICGDLESDDRFARITWHLRGLYLSWTGLVLDRLDTWFPHRPDSFLHASGLFPVGTPELKFRFDWLHSTFCMSPWRLCTSPSSLIPYFHAGLLLPVDFRVSWPMAWVESGYITWADGDGYWSVVSFLAAQIISWCMNRSSKASSHVY